MQYPRIQLHTLKNSKKKKKYSEFYPKNNNLTLINVKNIKIILFI